MHTESKVPSQSLAMRLALVISAVFQTVLMGLFNTYDVLFGSLIKQVMGAVRMGVKLRAENFRVLWLATLAMFQKVILGLFNTYDVLFGTLITQVMGAVRMGVKLRAENFRVLWLATLKMIDDVADRLIAVLQSTEKDGFASLPAVLQIVRQMLQDYYKHEENEEDSRRRNSNSGSSSSGSSSNNSSKVKAS